MSEESLREAYQRHRALERPANRDGCPTPEQLETIAGGHRLAAGDLALLEHVLLCARCGPEFELLRAVSGATRVNTARPSRSTWMRLGVAASGLLSLGVGTEVWRRSRAPVTRDASVDATVVVLESPVGTTTTANAGRLVWHAMPGATTYEVEVLDTTGTVMLTRVTVDTLIQVTTEELVLITKAAAFDWLVTARRSDGNERRSAVTRVRVVANAPR